MGNCVTFLSELAVGLAGTSDQAFGYEFKCQGFAYCIFTSWWELAYMIFTVTGVAAAFIGVAYCTLEKGAQKSWTLYAIISSFVYVIIILLGILLSNEFLLSFEFMLIFIFIGGCILFVQDLLYYHRKKKGLFPKIMGVWLVLLLVIIVYYIALESNFASALWAKGIWFNEDDVLHIMMIIWILYIYKVLGKALLDNKN